MFIFAECMYWSNWAYLGVGLLLGLGFSGLLARKNKPSSSFPVLPTEQQDVVKLQQQIKQTQLAYEMAREMSQFKAGYLARTTHVLRSPINGLIGLQQLILANLCENPEEEREFIKQAHDRTLKLLKLIDEILTVARLEHGTNKLDLQPRSLKDLLQEVYDLTYMLAENRNFPFKVLLPESELKVVVDSRWFKQVLINLIETAIAQMEEGGIYISTQTSPQDKFVYVWLDVPKQTVLQSEPIDLISSTNKLAEPEEDNIAFDPGMKFLLNQTLLEVMGGKLEIVPPLTTEQAEEMTRLQVTIPKK